MTLRFSGSWPFTTFLFKILADLQYINNLKSSLIVPYNGWQVTTYAEMKVFSQCQTVRQQFDFGTNRLKGGVKSFDRLFFFIHFLKAKNATVL